MVLNRRSLERSFSPMSKVKRKSVHVRKSIQYSPGSARNSQDNNKRQSNVKVIVRVRPTNEKESGENYRSIIQLVDDKMLVFDPKIDEPSFFYHGVKQNCRDLLKKQNKDTTYIFDKVFGFTSTNEEVFQGSTKEMIKTLLSGYNCSVFVYGATGAGKTYTMLGSSDSPGITYLTMVELYSEMEKLKDEKTFDLCVSYLEVYNENVRDLLQPSGPLHVREDSRAGVSVAGLKMETIDSADKLLAMLAQGNKNRTQHPTDANAESSRSHAVFQVHIRMTHRLSNQISLVKLSMVDLAGSERGSATGCTGARFTEGANINKSLLALGNCITNLAEGMKHIPYRDSKLTRLLKDSLGGNCYTVMIANISPSSKSYEDTQNTLKYATRAMKIKSTVKSNVVNCEMHVSQYARLVEELNRKVAAQSEEIASLKQQLKSNVVSEGSSAVIIECDEIHHWRKKLREMYKEKKKLMGEVLEAEMKRKTLMWRKFTKNKVADRVALLCYDSEQLKQIMERIEASQKQYKAREDSSTSRLLDAQAKELNYRKEIESTLKSIDEAGFTESVKDEILVNDLMIDKENAEIKSQHLKKLIILQQKEMDDHYKMFMTICRMLRDYYLMLKGFGKETNAMKASYQRAVRMLAGIKAITWEDSQNDEMLFLKEIMRLSAALKEGSACDKTPVVNKSTLLQDLKRENSPSFISKGSEHLPRTVDLSFCNEVTPEKAAGPYIITSPRNHDMLHFGNGYGSPDSSLYYTDEMGIAIRRKFPKDIRRAICVDDDKEMETHCPEADETVLKCEAEKICSALLETELEFCDTKVVPEQELDNTFSCEISITKTDSSAINETLPKSHQSPVDLKSGSEEDLNNTLSCKMGATNIANDSAVCPKQEMEKSWSTSVDFIHEPVEVSSDIQTLQAASDVDLNRTFSCEVEFKTDSCDSVKSDAACTLAFDLKKQQQQQQLESHILQPDLNNTFSCETKSQNAPSNAATSGILVASKKEEKCFLRPADVKCSVRKVQAASNNSTLDSTFCFLRDADASRKPVVPKIPQDSSFIIKRSTGKCKDAVNRTFVQHKKSVSPAILGKRNILSNRNTTNTLQKDVVSNSEVKHLNGAGKIKNSLRAPSTQNSTSNKENIYSPNITKRKIKRSDSMKLPVKKNHESMLPSKRFSPPIVTNGTTSYQQVIKPATIMHKNILGMPPTCNYGSKTQPEVSRTKNTCLLGCS